MTPLALPLSVLLTIFGGQSQPNGAGSAPVQDVTPRPTIDDVELYVVLQLPDVFHLRAHFTSIDGEPTAGGRYGIEATLNGERYIASASFELLNEAGAVVHTIPMVLESLGTVWHPVGMLTVPAHPFRIQMRATGIDGRQFRAIYRRLFRPEPGPASPRPQVDYGDHVPKQFAAGLRAAFDKSLADEVARREALVAASPAGPILMPRQRISKVTFAPYLSSSGRPLALRLTYQVEFDSPGRYEPSALAYQDYSAYQLRRSHQLQALDSTIVPAPRLVHAPGEPATFKRGAGNTTDFLYEAHVPYTFTVDLVPDYVRVRMDGTVCLLDDAQRPDPSEKEAWALRRASREAAAYDVSIGTDAFQGRIERFPSEATLYQHWVDEGTTACRR